MSKRRREIEADKNCTTAVAEPPGLIDPPDDYAGHGAPMAANADEAPLEPAAWLDQSLQAAGLDDIDLVAGLDLHESIRTVGEAKDWLEQDLNLTLHFAADDVQRIRECVAAAELKAKGEAVLEVAGGSVSITMDAPRTAAEIRLEKIEEVGERLHAAKVDWDGKKEEAKSAKKLWEGIAEELCTLVRQGDEPMPLFDTPKVAKEGLPPPTPEDESWREIPLGEALPMLTDAVHKKLAEAGMKNMGDLADWTKVEYSPGRFQALSDIKGIGKGTAEKIEDATMEFWRVRNAQQALPETDQADVSLIDVVREEDDPEGSDEEE